jgi:hypothetical protein
MLSKGAQNLNSITEDSAIDFLGNPRRRVISSNDDSPNDAIDLQNIDEKRAGGGIMVLN